MTVKKEGKDMKKIISTDKAPAAIGPFSQAVENSGFLFISGQLPIDPKTCEFAGEDIASQAEQSLKNMKAILEEAGYTLDDVVKTTCFLKDIADFAEFNGIYSRYFTKDYPARSCFAVKDLPKNALLEVEAIAVKK